MHKFVERFRDWVERKRLAREIAELSNREVMDLGLNRSELQVLTEVPRRVRTRMEAMARVFGADPLDIYLERWRNVELVNACHNCTAEAECAAQLAKPKMTRAALCSFCPNAGAFTQMAARRAPVHQAG